jgi:hypothetical protein
MRVVNASPLIHLARISLLELLRGPDRSIEVAVPAVVLDEVLRGVGHDSASGLVEAAARDWLTVVPTPTPHPNIIRARIDDGEIAVLSIARVTPGSTVVLDGRHTRCFARSGLCRKGGQDSTRPLGVARGWFVGAPSGRRRKCHFKAGASGKKSVSVPATAPWPLAVAWGRMSGIHASAAGGPRRRGVLSVESRPGIPER